MKMTKTLAFIAWALFISQSAVAGLYSLDYTGTVDTYVDNTGTGQYNGVLNSSATGFFLTDTLSTDQQAGDPTFGSYRLTGANHAGLTIGGFNFSSSVSLLGIYDNRQSQNLGLTDAMFARGVIRTASEIILFGFNVVDQSTTQFSSDVFNPQPTYDLTQFNISRFFVIGKDLTTLATNFIIAGSLSTLTDPPARIPVPNALLLFATGLLVIGAIARKRQQKA